MTRELRKQHCDDTVALAECQPSSIDPTGPVSTGRLVLNGWVIRSLPCERGIPLCTHSSQPEMNNVVKVYPDLDWSQIDNHPILNEELCCMQICRLDNGSYKSEYFLILELERSMNNLYKRAGLLELHIDIGKLSGDRLLHVQEMKVAVGESSFEIVTII